MTGPKSSRGFGRGTSPKFSREFGTVTRLRQWLCRHGLHAWRDAYVFFDHFSSRHGSAGLVGQQCDRCPARRHVARPRRYRIPPPGSHAYVRARYWVAQGDPP